MADQVLNPIHPHCQPVFDRITDLTATVQTLRLLAETEDEHDARRAARYVATALVMALEDVGVLTAREVADV